MNDDDCMYELGAPEAGCVRADHHHPGGGPPAPTRTSDNELLVGVFKRMIDRDDIGIGERRGHALMTTAGDEYSSVNLTEDEAAAVRRLEQS